MNRIAPEPAPASARLRLSIRGAVQGVGFRPFVHRLAAEQRVAGWVSNSPEGVTVELEGAPSDLEQCRARIEAEAPPRSSIQSLEASWLRPAGYERFEIRESQSAGPRSALVLPDIATCPDCLADIFDPRNRRHRYPFTNCTNCGPRFTIIESLPYDRANTSMRKFAMCPACRAEHDNPLDRRFHAQPNACPVCGPRLEFWPGERRLGEDALSAAVEALRGGAILAVKGIGGFHLMTDARHERSVRRLRERKRREEKPFALLFPSVESVREACVVSPLEERLLRSAEGPIVLLARAPASAGVAAEAVAPRNRNLGAMIPSNPLHHLLMADLGFPLVATSGNLSDEPICTDEREARKRLGDIADCFLAHDRPIVRHVDDSIVRVMAGREMMLRRARGHAPLPIKLPAAVQPRPVLAVGGHLKNSVALTVGNLAFVSQHIGDLETEQAHEAFRKTITDFQEIYQNRPELVAADLHPEYLSTQFAEKSGIAEKAGVQHHLAHVLSCMADNELAPPVLGVAWDGTGFGNDGAIWGGEFFKVESGRASRTAHLRLFPLPGGSAAVKEPRRAALGLLHELWGASLFEREVASLAAFGRAELALVRQTLIRRINAPLTSSAGRLFDATASILGLRQRASYEGQAAMELEHAIDLAAEGAYRFDFSNGVLDWAPAIRELLADMRAGIPLGEISAKFHNGLAESIVILARATGLPRVVLSGGCFQNRCLTERAVTRLRAAGFEPYWHRRVPCNDGGIALGQVVAVRNRIQF